MARTTAVFALLLVGCWRGPAQPSAVAPVAPVAPTSSTSSTDDDSYRNITLAVDAIGIGMIAGGMLLYRTHGLDSAPGNVLVAAGGLTGAFGSPIVHATQGHGGRAAASYLMRAGFASVGFLVAMSAGCADRPFCVATPDAWWGIAGGIALGGLMDALALHGSSSTWSPIVTPSDDGARVGIARTF